MGMKGTGFWSRCCEIARKQALSSEARSWVVDAGYFAKKSSTKEWGLLRDLKDCNTEAFAPPFTPANLSSTLLNQSPVQFHRLKSFHLPTFSPHTSLPS